MSETAENPVPPIASAAADPVDVSDAVAAFMGPVMAEYLASVADPTVPNAYSTAELARMFKEAEFAIREGDPLGTIRGEINRSNQIVYYIRVRTASRDVWRVVNCSEGDSKVQESIATAPVVLDPLLPSAIQ